MQEILEIIDTLLAQSNKYFGSSAEPVVLLLVLLSVILSLVELNRISLYSLMPIIFVNLQKYTDGLTRAEIENVGPGPAYEIETYPSYLASKDFRHILRVELKTPKNLVLAGHNKYLPAPAVESDSRQATWTGFILSLNEESYHIKSLAPITVLYKDMKQRLYYSEFEFGKGNVIILGSPRRIYFSKTLFSLKKNIGNFFSVSYYLFVWRLTKKKKY